MHNEPNKIDVAMTLGVCVMFLILGAGIGSGVTCWFLLQ